VSYDLDKELRRWLSKLAEDWEITVDEVAMSVAGYDEIDNRLKHYPILKSTLSDPVFELDKFAKAARECWALGGRYDLIRFGEFINRGNQAKNLIDSLISAFPSDETEASQRIDNFVNQAVRIGYSTPSGSVDWAGAALLSSVILTSIFPARFVDYRQSRWNQLAEAIGYDHSPSGEGHYGVRLIWAGKFAADISKTTTFQLYWPEGEPLWIVAGLCWYGPSPPKPQLVPQNIEDSQSYPEGGEKRRLHLTRERSQVVVLKAKDLALKRDPMLRCEVCGFSFLEKYGEHGDGFIEAHHTQPMSTLKAGSQTRVKDMALICGNCHRMIHRGERTLAINELRGMLKR